MALPSSQSPLQHLRRQLAGSLIPSTDRSVVPTPFSNLDALLPEHGIPSGSVIEWISDTDGIRATTIALKCAARFLDKSGAMVVIDPNEDFHATSVGHLGLPPGRLLIVRPGPSSSAANSAFDYRRTESLWALEQAARCSGVRIVMTWIDRISSTAQRRLQLAVERSGVTVFLIRPLQALNRIRGPIFVFMCGPS